MSSAVVPLRPLTAALASLLLVACASVPTERGRQQVGDALAASTGHAVELAAGPDAVGDDALRARLAAPLTEGDAVAIAWLNSPRTRQTLAGIGLAAADLLDARRPANPGISFGRLNGEPNEYTLGLHVVLTDLLLLPSQRRIAEAQWRATLAETADELLAQATDVRRLYWDYAAAEQISTMRAAVAEAAGLSAEMAARMHAAGNVSALQLAREEAQAVMAQHDAARARSARLAARLALAEALGLAGRTNRWSVAGQLPLPPAVTLELDPLLEAAGTRRLDLASAQALLEAETSQRQRVRRTRWIGEVELEVEHEREGDERRTGPAVSLELPLFQQGQARLARAEAGHDAAMQEVEAIRLAIEAEVRTLVERLATQQQIATSYRESLLPRFGAMVEREQERYNYMLVGVFEVLEARRSEFDAWQAYYEAIRDWWITRAELERATGTAIPVEAAGHAPAAVEVVAPPVDPEAEPHHGHH